MKQSKTLSSYLLISPYLAHILVFVLFPVGFSLFLSFHEWNIISPMEYVGLSNYEKLLKDQYFLKSLRNTLVFLGIHIPLQIIIALGLAVILNQKLWFRAFFRGAFFMPVVVSGVVITIMWQQMYGYELGTVNMLLQKIGIPKIGWLIDAKWAMPAIAIMATWKNVGLYIILFLVGLQSVPKSLYEAASIEGASKWQQFRWITIPAIKAASGSTIVVTIRMRCHCEGLISMRNLCFALSVELSLAAVTSRCSSQLSERVRKS